MPDGLSPRRCWRRVSKGLPEPEFAVIYALTDPDSGDVRYIGKTTGEPRQRLHLHLTAARKGDATPKSAWIRNLIANGKRPTLRVLERVKYSVWPQAERRWMELARDCGYDLLNVQVAGGGP